MIWNFRRSGQEPDLSLMLKHAVYALDSTTIDLCLSMFDWAAFRRTKAAVKRKRSTIYLLPPGRG
jgi:hypothetical protein